MFIVQPISPISSDIKNPHKHHIYFKRKRVLSCKSIITDTVELSTEAIELYLKSKESNEKESL